MRPMLSAACDWITIAGAMSIGVVFSELYSRKLISLGTHAFIIVMLLAILITLRIGSPWQGQARGMAGRHGTSRPGR